MIQTERLSCPCVRHSFYSCCSKGMGISPYTTWHLTKVIDFIRMCSLVKKQGICYGCVEISMSTPKRR